MGIFFFYPSWDRTIAAFATGPAPTAVPAMTAPAAPKNPRRLNEDANLPFMRNASSYSNAKNVKT
jgi:hypothetical protein